MQEDTHRKKQGGNTQVWSGNAFYRAGINGTSLRARRLGFKGEAEEATVHVSESAAA